ncbi:MAG: ester cyclase [Hamadaea sp.]|uniref:ester cyclase n=1 Tax=Hamadaea sp. NPDC050747 TaxID=3155789 RepID=UPI0017ECE418|nr:ester cyclase [Hamadaea sp.]NUR47395.1 ester cyclase [Hamadaea sp.]
MPNEDIWLTVATDVIGGGKLDLIDELFASDFVEHLPQPPGMPTGRDGFRLFCSQLHQAFPDLNLDVVHKFDSDDKHIGHVRLSGTMTGEFFGMPPANKAATWEEMHIVRVDGGQVKEHWGVVDQFGMLQQLGFVPAPGGH